MDELRRCETCGAYRHISWFDLGHRECAACQQKRWRAIGLALKGRQATARPLADSGAAPVETWDTLPELIAGKKLRAKG